MKPAPFAYQRPATLAEALDLLMSEGARPLAGGQSLVPLMNFRLARPTSLVDLNGLEELQGSEVSAHEVRLGALVRHAEVLRSAELRQALPLLPLAARHIGHRAVRERGTVGGSLAHADPAAEWPAVAVALGARLLLVSLEGERWLDADLFFQGYFTTALRPGELVAAVSFPRREGARYAFAEVSRRPGDFALVAVAGVAEGGRATLAFAGVGPRPVRATLALGNEAELPRVVAGLEPASDLHASAALRRRLAEVVGRSVLHELQGG